MEFMIAILALASPFLIYLICKSLILRHFQKIYNQTGKNPITLVQQILPTFIYLPILIVCCEPTLLYNVTIMLGIPCVALALVFISNLHWIRPGRIIGMTVCHLLYGTMTVLRVLWWVVICMFSILESVMYGNGFTVEYNPFIFLNVNGEGKVTEFKKQTFFFAPRKTSRRFWNFLTLQKDLSILLRL